MIQPTLILVRKYFQNYGGLSGETWLKISLNFINSIFISIFYFLPLYFVNFLHFKIGMAGFIISFYGVGTVLGGILAGKFSDKLGPGFITIASLSFQGISFLFLFILTGPFQLMLNLFVLGLSIYGFITSSYLWTLANCKDDENKKLKIISLLETGSKSWFRNFCIYN